MNTLKLISELTVTEIMQVGSDAMIAAAAWVSTSAESGMQRADKEPEAIPGLIDYLMKHRHGSPFEHGSLTVFTHLPIFVYREWHRHRVGFSYNEESARYKTLDPVFYVPPADRPMFKVENWKPGRPKFQTIEELEIDPAASATGEERYSRLCHNLEVAYSVAYGRYADNLALQFDPGLARDCLPVGIFSSCWVTCNPRSLMNFLSLRVHDTEARNVSYPLWEIDQAARKLEAIFARHWPVTHAAFVKNGRVAP